MQSGGRNDSSESCPLSDWTATLPLNYSTDIPVLPVSLHDNLTPMSEQLLTPKEVVTLIKQQFGVSVDVSTVRKWCTRGIGGANSKCCLPRVHVGGRVFVKLSRLQNWLQRKQLRSLLDGSETSL